MSAISKTKEINYTKPRNSNVFSTNQINLDDYADLGRDLQSNFELDKYY